MALGNDRPRDEPAKSKTRSLTALGQSLRRGLTTRRSAKNNDSAADKSPDTANITPSRTSTTLGSSYAKNSVYTPSPLSRGGVHGSGGASTSASGASSSLATGSNATLGLSSDKSGVYVNPRTQRIASASSAHLGGGGSGGTIGSGTGAPAAAGLQGASAGAYRKTIYGSAGLGAMSKSGMNNSSPSLVPSDQSSSATLRKNGPPPGGQGSQAGASNVNRDYSFVLSGGMPGAHQTPPQQQQQQHLGQQQQQQQQSARSSAGASVPPTREGYLSKKTDINPSTSLASALSRGWKVYRVVLKGAKLFFYKPPSESEMRAMFPEETAAATKETAGGYFRASTSTVTHDDVNGSSFPLAPGEIDAGSRAVLFSPGVSDGEIAPPLCERYVFGECFTEVDLRSLKFKRYVCALIFDDTIVVMKRRWVRQGLASSFFGAVSNKMRFGKGARVKNTQVADNSSLVSAELGIQGKGYFTKWKFHAQYPLTNVEAIEAASSRFSVSHSPGVLGHLGRESQTGSGRISLYSIGNSSVSSIMTRTSTVSKDYSGALSSGLVPGFQIFIGGKQRIARMFVATTSDAKNNWLSRLAAAKANFARRLRQRTREPAQTARRPQTAVNAAPGVASASATAAASGKDTPAEDQAGPADDRARPAKDARARLYWGTQRHPELIVMQHESLASANDDGGSGDAVTVVGGSRSALVHEMVFATAASNESEAETFRKQIVSTYPLLMSTAEFLREFQRYAELVEPELDGYDSTQKGLCETVSALAAVYATAYDADQIGILHTIAETACQSKDSVINAVEAMVPLAEADALPAEDSVTANSAAGNSSHASVTQPYSPPPVPDMPRLMSYEMVTAPPVQVENGGKPISGSSTLGPLRGRSRTTHADTEPSVPQIPSVPELIKVEVTGLSPSLLLRVTPAEFAHQLYLFHKAQLALFDPRQPRLFLPAPRSSAMNHHHAQPTPSLLTAGATFASDGDYSPAMHNSNSATVGNSSAGEPTAEASAAECELDIQRQLMVFTQEEPHFITRMIHHQLLVELPLNRPARRSALLQHWVRIGEECRIIGDAVSWAAIAMAVTMAPIARLRETWHGVAAIWKDLIVTEWLPLLISYGIYDTDIVTADSQSTQLRPLILRIQTRPNSSADVYNYTPIPYYGTIRICANRQGRRLKRQLTPLISGAAGSDAGDKVLFAHLGHMYGAVQSAIDNIPNIVVERARTSIMRSRASSVALASKFQQQQQQQDGLAASGEPIRRDSVQAGATPGSALVDPAMMGHPYLQTYLHTLAKNPLKIGDEVVESDIAEYDLRFLLSLSLQCEPSVFDQYQQNLVQDADGSTDDMAAAPSALRQALGSILPLVCPETVPSTNILQWITPATRTPVPTAQTVGRSSNASGRAGTFSHSSTASTTPDDGAGSSDSHGQQHPGLIERSDAGAEAQGLRHKRSRSFPADIGTGVHSSSDASNIAPDSKDGAAQSAENSGRIEQQIKDAAHGDATYAGSTIYAGNGDLALRVLRVQYSQSTSMAKGLRFVVEVQGGTLALLLDLLINGIEHHSAGITNDKGARIQLPGGSAPVLLFNRDVFQRTLLASFRHFCSGFDILDSMRRAMNTVDASRSWTAAESVFGALLDICENWLGQHFSDVLDSTALRESLTEFLQALVAAVKRAKPDDERLANWSELHERANMLLPDMISQLLTPSGFTPLDKVLDRRLAYAVNREKRSSTASKLESTLQSPLSLLSIADPDVMLVSLNRLAQTHFARCSFNDWIVAFCLLEVQTHVPLPWYPKKRIGNVPSEEDLVVSDIYQVLEQTHRTRVSTRTHDMQVTGAGVGVGVGVGGNASTVETSLVRTMPQSIQTMLDLHRSIRGWVIRQIADPACSLAQRVSRIQKFLTIVRLCRKDSQLSSSRVFGGLLNSYMREAGMIPDRQPSYRTNSIKGYSGVSGSSRVAGETTGRRGKRKGGQPQVKYVPSFVERAVASALVSPESRHFVRAWNDVAVENNTKLDTLEAALRGARDWTSIDPAPTAPTMPSGPGTNESETLASKDAKVSAVAGPAISPKPVAIQRSRSNPTTEKIDITEDSMARADCFVPCLGWLLENMVSLCYDTPDTLVSDSRLINLAKRHRVFIMLCVCDQLASRCQEAFALPTQIRIELGQLSTWVSQTPLQVSEIRAISQNEAAMGMHKDVGTSGSNSAGTPSAGSSSSGSSIGGSSSGSFSFSSPPTHTSGFVRPGDQMPPIRSGQGGFAKRSIANLRGASNSSSGSNTVVGSSGANGFYPRKSSMNGQHATPDFGGVNAFGSPPAPSPRSLAFADGPSNGMSPAGGNALNGSSGGSNGTGGAVLYMRPFARLVTDEVEKVRQEIRERERLERELRDREQAIERQKNERTKMLKRQLKEQQQRRAKNEPLLKMANLMNKVGISTREGPIDGGSGLSKGLSSYGALPQMNGSSADLTSADSNRLSSASTSSSMRPRGPALPNAKPANVINLINSTITVEQGYTKRDFVFRIVTEEGGQYLLQAPDGEQMEDWIAAMRDAATEAAARRLTLFVEEAKKRSTADGSSGSSAFPGLGDADGQQQQQQQHGQSRTLGASDTTRSRFTAFLGGSASAFSGFGLSSQTPPVPNRGALSNIHHPSKGDEHLQGAGGSKDMQSGVEPKSFGIDLAKLMPDPKVIPVIVDKCLTEIELRGLEEVGIYRVSGAAADVSRLRQLFNTDPDAVDLSSDEFNDINVVSGVMKQFLRELPEPLMTYNIYEGFINAASIDDYDERLWAIKDLVHALPMANYTLLKRLVEHLERVTDYEEVNHMYGTNLALVFGPSLLRPPPGSSSFALAMSNLGHAQSVIKNLILQYHWIFNVEEEAEPIEDGEVTADSTPETPAATIPPIDEAVDVDGSEAGADASVKNAPSNENATAVSDDENEGFEEIVSPNKRNSVAPRPLSANTQADMDQLALAVNNLSV
ncbi:hypothetical protein GGI15_003082 [Coemansia interrupta]|uniref:Uncharacterized protein n=1 Tax=Coemansia interrupta TaxID=1126814 RepID=A0A9W8HBE5_9FUNG|nr:hypothetical protein GGI15_003082 [Coemansia interrupta]